MPEARTLAPPEVAREHVEIPTRPIPEVDDSSLAKAAKSGPSLITLAVGFMLTAVVLGTLLGVMLTDGNDVVADVPAQSIVISPVPPPPAVVLPRPPPPAVEAPPPVAPPPSVEEIQPVEEQPVEEKQPQPKKKQKKKDDEFDVLYDKI